MKKLPQNLGRQVITQGTVNVGCVAEILENSTMVQWRHVKGVEKPAEMSTRGISIEGLKGSVWLKGLARLQRGKGKWPKL